jgi:hypothetical protein
MPDKRSETFTPVADTDFDCIIVVSINPTFSRAKQKVMTVLTALLLRYVRTPETIVVSRAP